MPDIVRVVTAPSAIHPRWWGLFLSDCCYVKKKFSRIFAMPLVRYTLGANVYKRPSR